MENQKQKVYVFIGNDPEDNFKILEWVLRRWSSKSISMVIIHAAITNSTSKKYVETPFGKMPASSVSDEKLQDLRKSEQGKIDNMLLKCIAFCGKVQAEILKIHRDYEPIHKILVELIYGYGITKLVMGTPCLKSLAWKSGSAMSELFYVYRHKPQFCQLFIIFGGKLVFLREDNNEGFIEDENGVMVAKVKAKASFRVWLGKMFHELGIDDGKNLQDSPPSSGSNDSPDQWKKCAEEIENYFQELLSSNTGEQDNGEANGIFQSSLQEPNILENMNAAQKIQALKISIARAHEAILLNRNEAKANVERQAKAEWAVCLCTRRAEELEASRNEEMAKRLDLQKDLNATKEEILELRSEVEEKKRKLNSIEEIQRELSNKLQLSSVAKSRVQAQIENLVKKRVEMIQEIEVLRTQRDVFQRRIEFCREKDAAGVAECDSVEFKLKEFGPEEIRAATDGFSPRLRLKSAGDWTNVYKGRIKHTSVAIKLYDSGDGLSQEDFQAKAKLLSQIRHPHLLAIIGFCSELKCIVFEYMHNGCLRDALFSSSSCSKRRTKTLNWHDRIRIATEVWSGLGFLHQAQPRPIFLGNLNPSKILLDFNNVAKIHGFSPPWRHEQAEMWSDIWAFGNLLLQLLTGRNWAGLVEEAIVADCDALLGVLDQNAGKWPLDLAVELSWIAIRCLSIKQGKEMVSTMEAVTKEINQVKKKADNFFLAAGECPGVPEGGEMEELSNVPSVFLCPIFQDVMKNPQVAADGFSYEQEAIEEWLRTGHDTSPMTNLKLKHKQLTSNHTLRSLIQDWQLKRSTRIEHFCP